MNDKVMTIKKQQLWKLFHSKEAKTKEHFLFMERKSTVYVQQWKVASFSRL
nr:MAG TPA: hypothetical protein [Caudoviricetes sp.]